MSRWFLFTLHFYEFFENEQTTVRLSFVQRRNVQKKKLDKTINSTNR